MSKALDRNDLLEISEDIADYMLEYWLALIVKGREIKYTEDFLQCYPLYKQLPKETIALGMIKATIKLKEYQDDERIDHESQRSDEIDHRELGGEG